MNKFVLGALATAVAGGTSLASETEWPELDRELEALSSTYQAQTPGGPEFGGWVIAAADFSGDLTTTINGEDKDLSGIDMRSARLYARGEVDTYGYKLEFDFFNSEESLYFQYFSGGAAPIFTPSEDDGTGQVLDAYGEVNVADSFRIRLGQFRTPLLQSALIDRNRTLFIDRSLLGSAFSSRDPGAMLYGDFEMVGWYLAIQNGTDGVADDYLFTGRLTIDVLGSGAGKVNEGAYNSSEETSLFIGAAFSDDGALQNGTVIAAEAYLTAGPFGLAGELADLDVDLGDNSPWAATGSFLITEAYELAIRWEELDDTDNTRVFSGGINWYHDDWNTKWQFQYSTSSSDNVLFEVDAISLGLAVSF